MAILLLMTAHLLGDFMFQSAKIAHKKLENIKYFLLHCMIYAIFIFLALISFGPLKNIIFIFIFIVLSHAIIDYCRIKISLSINKKQIDFALFVIDQIAHIIIILICAYFIKGYSAGGYAVLNALNKHIQLWQLYNILVYILMFVICLSPTAVFIKKVFIFFSMQNYAEVETEEELIKSGYLIGILERTIILILGFSGQTGAIGFVLAAKSLARFKQLENRNFAEKYLVGTLLSAAISLFCIVVGNLLLIK